MPAAVSAESTDDRPSIPPTRRRRRLIVVAAVAVAVIVVVLVWFQPQTLLFDTVVEDEFPTVTSAVEPDQTPASVDAEVEPPPETATGDQASDEATVDAADPDEGAGGDAADPDEGAGGDGADPQGEGSTETAAPVEPAAPQPTADQPVALATGAFASRNRYTVTGAATAYELADSSRLLRLEGFESTNGPDLFVYLTVGDAGEPDDAALAAEFVDLGALRGNVGDQNYTIPAEVDLDRYDTVVIWCERFGTAFGATDLG